MLEKQSGLFLESTPKADGLTSAKTFHGKHFQEDEKSQAIVYVFQSFRFIDPWEKPWRIEVSNTHASPLAKQLRAQKSFGDGGGSLKAGKYATSGKEIDLSLLELQLIKTVSETPTFTMLMSSLSDG